MPEMTPGGVPINELTGRPRVVIGPEPRNELGACTDLGLPIGVDMTREAPKRPNYYIEPDLLQQQQGASGAPAGTQVNELGAVIWPDTGETLTKVRRPGVLPLAITPDGPELVMPKLLDAASNIMGGVAGGAEAGGKVLGSGFLRPAIKHEGKVYKMEGHSIDFLPEPIKTWAKENKVDIDNLNLGFSNHKGQFLTRERAAEYAVNHGLVPNKYETDALEYGLTSDMLYNTTGKILRSGVGGEEGALVGAATQLAKQPPVKAPAWHSAVENALEQTTMGAASGAQWLATLRNSRGVKPEEMSWLGLDDMLAAAQVEGRKVSRAELQDWVQSHKVELKEVTKQGGYDDGPVAMPERGYEPTKYQQYVLPGGENYREMLLTLPDRERRGLTEWYKGFKGKLASDTDSFYDLPTGRQNVLEKLYQQAQQNLPTSYHSSHWDEANILAHMRMNDRMIDGKKSLHLEEIQSDWHQAGRNRGYKKDIKPEDITIRKDEHGDWQSLDPDGNQIGLHGPALSEAQMREQAMADLARRDHDYSLKVPDAPFKKTWHELALKRALREAAEKGYDRLSWTPGEAQAARYDLSKQIDALRVIKNEDGTYHLRAQMPGGGMEQLGTSVAETKLPDLIGKDLAKKIAEQPVGARRYESLDLKIGGEGMKGFYDQMIPKALEKLVKEHGVKVQRGHIEPKHPTNYADAEGRVPIWYIDIPPSLREQAMQRGYPLFSGGNMFIPQMQQEPQQ